MTNGKDGKVVVSTFATPIASLWDVPHKSKIDGDETRLDWIGKDS